MPTGSSPKQERQYEHIKDNTRQRGESSGTAKRIAAATVNKERSRSGETKNANRSANRTSTRDVSSGRRGNERSGAGANSTKDQLYAEAKRRNIKGRSAMNKSQLENALAGR